MKYLITENKMEDVIETFLKKRFDNIVWVKFKKVKTFLANDDKTIEVTKIVVLVDPIGILEGNLYSNKTDYSIRGEIWNELNSVFSLDMDKYGSMWDLEVFELKASVI